MLNHCSRLFHPGTMHGHKVAHAAGVSSQPVSHLLSLVHFQVVHHQIDARFGDGKLLLQLGEERYELDLPFAYFGPSVDLACPGIKRSKQMQGTC
jgi:hypothetical protein